MEMPLFSQHGGALLHQLRAEPAHRGIVRWSVDVDPLQL